jgi:amino acid adenylation domain-containing protein
MKDTKIASSSEPRPLYVKMYPLSIIQEKVWTLKLYKGSNAQSNNNFLTIRIIGEISVPRLEECIKILLERHEVLRSRLDIKDHELVQHVLPSSFSGLDMFDFQGFINQVQKQEQIDKCFDQYAYTPIDFSEGLNLRTLLISVESKEHILLLVVPEAISDEESLNLLFRELSTLYEESLPENRNLLSNARQQFFDSAFDHQETLQEKEIEKAIDYWKLKLDTEHPLLELVTDYSRKSVKRHYYNDYPFDLPMDLCDSFEFLEHHENATLFEAALTTFAILLHFYSDQEDLLVGADISLRDDTNQEDILGPFTNTFPVLFHLDNNSTFRTILGQIKNTCSKIRKSRELPVDFLSGLIASDSIGHEWPFRISFSVNRFQTTSITTPSKTFNLERKSTSTSKSDIAFSIINGEKISGRIRYRTDLFGITTIENFAEHFCLLLRNIIVDPGVHLKDMQILTDAERQQILIEWNSNKDDDIPSLYIHQLFEAQADKSPDAYALVGLEQEISYSTLNRRANQLARFLQKSGANPQTIIGICLKPSTDRVVGMLGIFKAGGVYLPLDPSLPKERLELILRDSEANILVTEQALLSLFANYAGVIICLDSDWENIVSENSQNVRSDMLNLDNSAYIIYTSGSTGDSKGVVVSHRSLANHCYLVGNEYNLTAKDKVLQFASPSFDVSLEQMISPLIVGAEVVIPETLWEINNFHNLINEFKITVVNLPPAYWRQIIRYWLENQLSVPKSLRLMIVGGDVMEFEDLARWRNLHPNSTRLLNAYGPTETTITATLYDLTNFDGFDTSLIRIPIGRPLANRKVYILNKAGLPVPIGVPGELHIGGACIAKGYLNRPTLTNEKFVVDPFSEQIDARMYKTGDIARWLPGGNIDFLGRLDYQVKIRGNRVELGEIEAVLSRHPSLHEAVVVAQNSNSGEKKLIAYIVSANKDIKADMLRAYVGQALPSYMIPSLFVFIESLPVTATGKINRKLLMAPESASLNISQEYVSPKNDIEAKIIKVWKDVLGLDTISVTSSFIEIGGSSLFATQVLSRIHNEYKVKLSLEIMFDASTTVEVLSNIIEQGLKTQKNSETPPLTRLSRDAYRYNVKNKK